MVDFVVSLRANGHRGPIYAMSRRGLLPQAHRPVSAVTLKREDIPFGASLVTLWRWLRRLAEDNVARGGDWRSVVDGIRPYTWEIWRSLPFNSKQRFLRHARAWWEVHRHRMAPEVEQQIQGALASGELRIIAAKTLALVPSAALARITYRRRGSDRTETLDVAKVAECTGVYTDPLATTNPLLKQVIAQKLARTDPLGIGIDVDANCSHHRPIWARLAGALCRRASDPRRVLGNHGGAGYPRAMRRARSPFARAPSGQAPG